ncbi:MarR family transcriptional regulator [Nocardia yamanashiensis]|uniref:MarR family transcriptional regulator n=1 Tax=Nocardia yamanashiensis TaxID=209247 RepID=UPI0038CD618A
MALTEIQARVLGVLIAVRPDSAMTVRELAAKLELTAGTVRRALCRLAGSGLVLSSPHSPANWRVTVRGRLVAKDPVYREFLSIAEAEGQPAHWLQYHDGQWAPVWSDGRVGDPVRDGFAISAKPPSVGATFPARSARSSPRIG